MINIERGDNLEVGYVIFAEADMHQSGDLIIVGGVAVIPQPLDQRARTISYAYDCHANRCHDAQVNHSGTRVLATTT